MAKSKARFLIKLSYEKKKNVFETSHLIAVIATIVITVTLVDSGDAMTVRTGELVGSYTSRCTVLFIKTVSAIVLVITDPGLADTSAWTSEGACWT